MTPSRRDFLGALGALAAGCAAGPRPARAQGPALSRGPYLQDVRGDRATIVWATRENGAASVEYSTDRGYGLQVSARTREIRSSETGIATYYQHAATLVDLSPGARYFYRAVADGRALTSAGAYELRTPAAEPFRFVAVGDSGMATVAQGGIAERIEAETPDLLIHVGDLAYASGTYEEFQRLFFAPFASVLRCTPLFTTPGNHEYLTQEASPYLSLFAPPHETVPEQDRGRYYAFDWGNAHFVSLDTNTPLLEAARGEGAMLDWLEDDLARTRKFWRIVFCHHGAYACGPSETDLEAPLLREHVAPILERHGVQLVLNGHHHSYQRTHPIERDGLAAVGSGIVYVTTGGGGAGLYRVGSCPSLAVGASVHHYLEAEVRGSRLTARAIGADGAEIDAWSLAPEPRVSEVALSSDSLSTDRCIAITGHNLAAEELEAEGPFFPLQLGGTIVHLDGMRQPLVSVSASEIVAQVRRRGRGSPSVRVTTENGWSETTARF